MVFLHVYFPKILPTKLATPPRSSSIGNQRDKWPWTNQQHFSIASRRVIGLTYLLSIEQLDWPEGALVHLHCSVTIGRDQSKYGDVADLSRATYHSLWKGSVNVVKYVDFKRKANRCPLFFIKLGLPKLRFYQDFNHHFCRFICHYPCRYWNVFLSVCTCNC